MTTITWRQNYAELSFHKVKSITFRTPNHYPNKARYLDGEDQDEGSFSCSDLTIEFMDGSSQDISIFMEEGIKHTVTLEDGWNWKPGDNAEHDPRPAPSDDEEIPF